MKNDPYLRISLKHYQQLPLDLRQRLLIYLPQVWCVWKPYIKWLPWWGRWVPNNMSLN